jgi:hypothetical protein
MVNLVPTEQMAANAKRGLEMRREYNRGGTAQLILRLRATDQVSLDIRRLERSPTYFGEAPQLMPGLNESNEN